MAHEEPVGRYACGEIVGRLGIQSAKRVERREDKRSGPWSRGEDRFSREFCGNGNWKVERFVEMAPCRPEEGIPQRRGFRLEGRQKKWQKGEKVANRRGAQREDRRSEKKEKKEKKWQTAAGFGRRQTQ